MEPAGDFSKAHCDPILHDGKKFFGLLKTKKQMYRIIGRLSYTWEMIGVVNRLTLPDGFEFDGASVPAWATWLSDALPFTDRVDPFGSSWQAAAFHDFIWKYKGRLPEGVHVAHLDGQWKDVAFDFNTGKPIWTFKTSNKLFARHLRELGISTVTRRAMYLAVSSPVGWYNWITGKLPSDARRKDA